MDIEQDFSAESEKELSQLKEEEELLEFISGHNFATQDHHPQLTGIGGASRLRPAGVLYQQPSMMGSCYQPVCPNFSAGFGGRAHQFGQSQPQGSNFACQQIPTGHRFSQGALPGGQLNQLMSSQGFNFTTQKQVHRGLSPACPGRPLTQNSYQDPGQDLFDEFMTDAPDQQDESRFESQLGFKSKARNSDTNLQNSSLGKKSRDQASSKYQNQGLLDAYKGSDIDIQSLQQLPTQNQEFSLFDETQSFSQEEAFSKARDMAESPQIVCETNIDLAQQFKFNNQVSNMQAFSKVTDWLDCNFKPKQPKIVKRSFTKLFLMLRLVIETLMRRKQILKAISTAVIQNGFSDDLLQSKFSINIFFATRGSVKKRTLASYLAKLIIIDLFVKKSYQGGCLTDEEFVTNFIKNI